MQEVSRVGAQGVTSKSKLLAREMPDLHTGGLRVDCGAARSRKGARAESRFGNPSTALLLKAKEAIPPWKQRGLSSEMLGG